MIAARNKKMFSGKPKSALTRAKMSLTHQGKTMPPKTSEQLARQREGQRRYWASLTPEQKAARVALSVESRKRNNRPMRNRVYRDTKLELYLESLLIALGFEFKKQAWIGRYCVDFLITNIPGKLIFEANGCYWHDCPHCYGDEEQRPGKRQHDAKRRADLEARGYQVIEMWDHELPDWPLGPIDWEAVEASEEANV